MRFTGKGGGFRLELRGLCFLYGAIPALLRFGPTPVLQTLPFVRLHEVNV